jgi:hypothetical protein
MASMSALPFEKRPRTIRLSRHLVYALTASVMAVVGALCSTAAFAAGVHSVDMLALLFSMGALGALFILVVWYILQLHPR